MPSDSRIASSERANAGPPAGHPGRHLAHRGLLLAGVSGSAIALLLAVPSLAGVRREFALINPWWIVAGVGLEIGSCVSFVVVFRAFFDEVPAVLARRIAWVEEGSGALLPELPADCRAAVVLRDLEGLSTQQAANVVDASQATFKSRLHGGPTQLRALLAPYLGRAQQ